LAIVKSYTVIQEQLNIGDDQFLAVLVN
jgi:hypothetical protein